MCHLSPNCVLWPRSLGQEISLLLNPRLLSEYSSLLDPGGDDGLSIGEAAILKQEIYEATETGKSPFYGIIHHLTDQRPAELKADTRGLGVSITDRDHHLSTRMATPWS